MYGAPRTPPPPMPGPPPPRNISRSWLLVAGAAVVLLVLVGLIVAAGSENDVPAAATTPAAKPTPSRITETWQVVPVKQREAFLAELRRIDPGLTPASEGARARPLRRAVSVCWDIYGGASAATVLRNTAARYDGGQASVPAGSVKAQRVLVAVRRWICASGELRAVYDARHPAD